MARRRRNRRVSEQVELSIDSLSHDGRGLALREGKRVFVEGALAEERIIAEINLKKSRYEEGKVLELLTQSPDRVEPRCQHSHICGGCSLQHLDSSAQIEMKQAALLEQLSHFGSAQPEELLDPIAGPLFGYRHKARLGVRYVTKKEQVLVGFREKGSAFITEVDACPILVDSVGEKIQALRDFIASLEAYRSIPQIEVAVGDDASALVFRHLEVLSQSDVDALVSFAKAEDFHLYFQPGGPETVHKMWPQDSVERLSYALPDFDLEMLFHPMDFTQINPDINRQIVNRAVHRLDPQSGERVLDLFCGLGNFSLALARSGAQVIGVEGSAAMVERGYENAKHNGIDNVEFYAADLTQDFEHQPWAAGGFDRILIDPPRSGALEIVEKIAHFGARRIVYVSCNPATLARDAGVLNNLGYSMESAGVMDMFPHTAHVESMAVFNRISN